MELFIYLLKSAAILALFYLVYWFALRRHTLFIANRQYLLTGIVAALVLPLISYTKTVLLPAPETVSVANVADLVPLEMIATQVASEPIDWFFIMALAYSAGVLFCVLRFAYNCYALLRVLKSGNYAQKQGYFYVETERELEPFSFFKYLVYNPELHSEQELDMIIKHEKAHASGWHTLDVLLGNLLTVVHWLNPLAWWYKKSMIQNLEFIADRQTIDQIPSKKEYQLALVKASTQGQKLELSSSFYQSFIKNRIVMLNTNQSHKTKRWRLLLIAPLLALFMYSFNIKERISYVASEHPELINASAPSFLIDKFSTEADLQEIENYFIENHADIRLDFSDEKWIDEQLVAYQMTVEFPESESGGGKLIDENTDTEITPRVISVKEGPAIIIEHPADRDDYIVIDYKGLSYHNPEVEVTGDALFAPSMNDVNTTNGNAATTLNASGTSSVQDTSTTTIISGEQDEPEYLFIINEKPWQKNALPVDKKIVTTGYVEMLDREEGLVKFGQSGEDGVLVVHGEARFVDKDRPKSTTVKPTAGQKDITIVISADMSRDALTEKIQYLKEEHDITLDVRNVEYNDNGKIVALELSYSANGSSGSYSVNNDGEPIDDVIISFDEDGGMSAGSINSEAQLAERKVRMEARAQAMAGRKMALASAKEARAAELALRKEEMASMSAERKSELKAAMVARKAEMAVMQGERKAEMKARKAQMKAREKAIKAEQKALAKSTRASGYARVTSTASARGAAATIAGDVYIDKNTSDAELDQIKRELAAENVTFTYKRVRRNARGEITGIRISLDNNKGSKSSTNIKSSSDKPIDAIHLEY